MYLKFLGNLCFWTLSLWSQIKFHQCTWACMCVSEQKHMHCQDLCLQLCTFWWMFQKVLTLWLGFHMLCKSAARSLIGDLVYFKRVSWADNDFLTSSFCCCGGAVWASFFGGEGGRNTSLVWGLTPMSKTANMWILEKCYAISVQSNQI